MHMKHTNIRIFQDLDMLSQAAADAFLHLVQTTIDEKNFFTVALTGGSTVAGLYDLLAVSSRTDKVDLGKILFYWGDERLVPPEHAESNYGQAKHHLLDQLPNNPRNIYRMRGELEPYQAIKDYQEKLQEQADEGWNWPQFDLVLLGMGSDGHIASIFPGEISKEERNSPVIATQADYQGRPGERVSLTPLVFNSAKNIFFLVSGESKAATLKMVFSDQRDPVRLPVHRIQPKDGKITWFVDKASASQLPDAVKNMTFGR